MIRTLSTFSMGLLAALLLVPPRGQAQTVGGVFGPGVTEGDRSVEYRAALAPVNGFDDVLFVHRFHYQRAVDGQWRVRGVLQASDTETGTHEFNFFQGELQWQFLEKNRTGVSSALRLDGRVTEGDDGPDLISLNSTTQWDLDDAWRATGVVLVGRELGAGARDGINLETRASLSRRVGARTRLGVESFNLYGNSTGGFGPVSAQRHSLGPVATVALDRGWSLLGGALFGVTDGAPNQELRLWVGKAF